MLEPSRPADNSTTIQGVVREETAKCLSEISATKPIRTLYACEAGSRMRGFSSPTSYELLPPLDQEELMGVAAVQEPDRRVRLLRELVDRPSFGPKKISGAAGTGKTSVIKVIAQVAREKELSFVAVAPTGRAARRVTELTEVRATTIHSRLYRPKEHPLKKKLDERLEELHKRVRDGELKEDLKELRKEVSKLAGQVKPVFIYNPAEDLIEAEMLVIDEASMVSLNAAEDLLRAAAAAKHVIAIGDEAQLPPVEGDPWFHNLETTGKLEQVWRQAEGSGILNLAQAIQQGNWPDPTYNYGEGVEVISGGPKVEDLMVEDAGQCIVGYNKTRSRLAVALRQARGLAGDAALKLPWYPNDGETLMVIRNDAVTGLMNGDIVVVKNIDRSQDARGRPNMTGDLYQPNGTMIQLSMPLNYDALLKHYDPDYNPRYADGVTVDFASPCTCHKAQGSEYDSATVVFEPIGRTPMDRQRWAYTAVTRAKKHLRVFLP